ncbi:MAG: hypothetical protein KAI66_07720, partial [Lentisphaeria bacterium]|nr:hypothetical protein [Lentisphaeria bacterium]
MKRALIAFLVVASTIQVFAQGAEEKTSQRWFPLQLAIIPEVQIADRSTMIDGIKLNLWCGRNDRVNGVDLGVFSGCDDITGVQVNVANYVENKVEGIRIGVLNGAKDVTGFSAGVVNWNDGALKGIAVGLVNVSDEVAGLQIGVFNYCRRLGGVQIGLINISTEKTVKFFPIVNI